MNALRSHERPGRPRTLALLAVPAVLTACASHPSAVPGGYTPPPTENRTLDHRAFVTVFNEPGVGARVVNAPVANVWSVLDEVYGRLGIPVGLSHPAELEFGNGQFRARGVEGERLSKYFDCGRGPLGPHADTYEVTLSVITRLVEASTDSTVVVTTSEGSAKSRGTSGNPLYCASNGTLELRIAQLALEETNRAAQP